MPDSIKRLADLFAKFPTIGSRTANRFVFYLIKQPKEKVDELLRAIEEVKKNIKLCQFCFNPHESEYLLCNICKNPSRNKQLLCVIEKEADLLSIEDTKRYNGFYFILGGNVSSMKISDVGSLRIQELKERAQNPQKFGLTMVNFSEIIIATNPTQEGKATSILIEKALKEISPSPAFKITRLAQGLPVGGELEYADEETLESAFEGRK